MIGGAPEQAERPTRAGSCLPAPPHGPPPEASGGRAACGGSATHKSARIGVLALQGAFAAHAQALERLGHAPALVRLPVDLEGLDGVVLPGGESTTMLNLLERFALWEPLDGFVRAGAPVLATCAGLILAARGVTQPAQRSFGWLDVDVVRNGWGRQLDSFEARADAPRDDLPLVLIRAPRLARVGPGVEVLATYEGEPVLVRAGAITGATFHPELTASLEVHRAVFGEAGVAAAC